MAELELIPLCSARLPVSESITIENTPQGTFMVGELRDARWEGERFKASQRGAAAADWLTLHPDGTAIVDVRLTLETDDGALVFVAYGGRLDTATLKSYATPTFKTGDERYAWMNKIQAVGKGHFDPDAMLVTYEMIYELR